MRLHEVDVRTGNVLRGRNAHPLGKFMNARLANGFVSQIGYDRFQFDEGAERFDCVEMDAHVVPEIKLPVFADNATDSEDALQGGDGAIAIGDIDEVIIAATHFGIVGAMVGDQLRSFSVDRSQFEPSVRSVEIDIFLLQHAFKIRANFLAHFAGDIQIGIARFELDVSIPRLKPHVNHR